MMKKYNNIFQLFMPLIFCIGCTQERTVPIDSNYQAPVDLNWNFDTANPILNDEFGASGLPDPSKWSYDVGNGGWGNNELEYYTDNKNASVNGGLLSIEANKESFGGSNYTSARMVTKGKEDFLYGRFEIKAKVPNGRGLWPAIWLLSTDQAYGTWPNSGEIDIMEQVGFDPNNIHCTVHNNAYNGQKGNQKSNNSIILSATTDFHVYRVDWTPFAIRGYIDDEQYFEYINEGRGFISWPYDKKFYLILNVAVGGNWGGANGIDDLAFPGKMQIDYVKVYPMIPK